MAFDFPSSPTTGQTYSVTGGPTYVYNGTAWVVLTPGNQFNRTVFTATAGQTTFSITYTVGAIDVYRNGVKLVNTSDFTATDGTSIVLLNAANAGDTIEVISYPMITYSDAVRRSGDTMTGNLNFSGNGLRITGDLSNSTVANRLIFQTSTTNGQTRLTLIPNGSAVDSAIDLYTSSSDLVNVSRFSMRTGPSDMALVSTREGTGAYIPMTFQTGGSERLRIDTSGNVGIGTSSPSAKLHVTSGTPTSPSYPSGNWASTVYMQTDGASYNGLVVGNRYAADNSTIFEAGSLYGGGSAWASYYKVTGIGTHIWGSGVTGSERARITSGGDFCVGTNTPTAGARFTAFSAGFQTTLSALYNGTDAGTPVIRTYHQATSGSARLHIYFSDGTTNGVGSITSNGTSTSYNTSSDYRLKENVQPMQNALAKVALLNPVTYTWKVDGSDGQGFIAHELQTVVPDCVTGEKDAEDAEGNPIYQGVDTSFLVATLVKAIQEQQTQIEDLKSRIVQLEGGAA